MRRLGRRNAHSFVCSSEELSLVLGALHLEQGEVVLADAVIGAHLLHSLDVLDLEVDEALVEAVDLGLDHESCGGELVVRLVFIDEIRAHFVFRLFYISMLKFY